MRARSAHEQERLTVARLAAAAWRDASVGEASAGDAATGAHPAEPQTVAAVRELREIAVGRGDLLAEVAGLLIGYYRRDAGESRARSAAYLCISAGARIELLPEWIEVGCSRAAAARLIPPAVPVTGLVYEWPEAV